MPGPPHNNPATGQPYLFGFLTDIVNINFPGGYFIIIDTQTSATGITTGDGATQCPSPHVVVPDFSTVIPQNSILEIHDVAEPQQTDTNTTLWNIWPSDSVSPYLESLATYSSLGIPPFTEEVVTMDTQAEAQAIIDDLGPFPPHPYLAVPATSQSENIQHFQTVGVFVNPTIDPNTNANTPAVISLSLGDFNVPDTFDTDTIDGASSSVGSTEAHIILAVFYAPQKKLVDPPEDQIGIQGPPWPIQWLPNLGGGVDVNTTILLFDHVFHNSPPNTPAGFDVQISLKKLSTTDPTQVELTVTGPVTQGS